ERLVDFVPDGRQRLSTGLTPSALRLGVDDDALKNDARTLDVERQLVRARQGELARDEGQISNAPDAHPVGAARRAQYPDSILAGEAFGDDVVVGVEQGD